MGGAWFTARKLREGQEVCARVISEGSERRWLGTRHIVFTHSAKNIKKTFLSLRMLDENLHLL